MPFYEFLCPNCGKITEEFCSMEERPKTIMCQCGGRAKFVVSGPPTDFRFADKDTVRIPSNPTSVYIRRK